MPRFFTGKSVSSHTLVASPANTFRDFIQQFINLPVPLSVTYAEYHAMSKKERANAKLVGYVVAATFPKSPWEGRKLEHSCPCNLVILDIDDANDARRFVQEPSLLIEALGKFNFAAYQTISSTPLFPRIRVIVEADNIPVERYPDAALTVGQLLGLPKVTRESAIVCQPMFRPTVFADQDPELEHPVLVMHFGGRSCKPDDISTDVDSLPGIVSGSKPSRGPSSGSIDDFLTFFQFPVAGVDLAQIEEALTFIDADCSRPLWLEIAAALKHQFGALQDDEAFTLFDTWSATGTKYEDEKDTGTVWKSFQEQAKGRKPVTIRSLLKRAVEGGWNSDKVKESSFKTVSNWIMFECKSAVQLMNEGVRRIAAAPLLSHIEEGALLQTLVTKSRQDYQQPLPLMDVKRELKSLRESLIAKRSESAEVIHPPWSLGFVYIAATDTFLRHRTRQEYKKVAFDSVFARKLLPTAAELQAIGRDVNEQTLNTPKVLPSLYLLNHLKCQTVDDVTYNPSAPEDIITREEGKLFVNLYRRSFREADKSLANYAEDVLCEQLCNIITEPAYRTHLLDWIAYHAQFPGSKVRHALLVQGVEGCGKTLLFGVIRAILGLDNTRLINSDTIKKGWNDWAFGSQVVCIEELRVAGQNRHELMNTLKEPITNDYLPVNERNKNTRNIQNRTNYMAFTNHHDAIVVGEDSRRWWVVKSKLQHKEQIRAIVDKDPEYFSRFADSLTTHAGGYRHLFENRTISSTFRPSGPAPITTYLQEMIADTSDDVTAVLNRIWDNDECNLIQPNAVALGALRAALVTEGIQNVTPKYLTHVLRNAGFSPAGRHMLAGERQYVWARTDRLEGQNPVEMLLHKSENSSNVSDA
jgi:hypothetical protein